MYGFHFKVTSTVDGRIQFATYFGDTDLNFYYRKFKWDQSYWTNWTRLA